MQEHLETDFSIQRKLCNHNVANFNNFQSVDSKNETKW